jgi:hypothetical protein
MLAQHFEIGDQIIEVVHGDVVFIECRHRAEALSHLKLQKESGKRLVIDRRSYAAFTARVQAARVLGIGVPALKSRLHRARARLRQELDCCFQ